MDIARTQSPFADIALPDFVDIILEGGERGDEAMYYLLHERLERQLRHRFEVYQHQLLDDFEDVVEDFFLDRSEGELITMTGEGTDTVVQLEGEEDRGCLCQREASTRRQLFEREGISLFQQIDDTLLF